jgi:diguanylate cyclase (GGDEF)-like protein
MANSWTTSGTNGTASGSTLMGFPARLRPATRGGIDWKRPDVRDAFVLLGAAVLALVVAHVYDLPPILNHLGLNHPDWKPDDTIFLVVVLLVAPMIYGFRRYRELSREIKARISAEIEARNLARHDPLTGLPNRRFFEERLEECLGSASLAHQVAILTMDLDGFKVINDTHGHAVGDQALCEFARRVSVIVRVDAFLARIGGDEFTILMPCIGSLDDPTNLARRIAAAVVEPFVLENVTVEVGVGIGIDSPG